MPLDEFSRDKTRHDGLTVWCKPCVREAARGRALTEEQRARKAAATKASVHRNRERINERNRVARRARREWIIAHYGGRCACCEEARLEFLAIDHIEGGGTAHRREVGKGDAFYKWLKAQGYPLEGYRVLCHNCNLSLGFYGYCPHQA